LPISRNRAQVNGIQKLLLGEKSKIEA